MKFASHWPIKIFLLLIVSSSTAWSSHKRCEDFLSEHMAMKNYILSSQHFKKHQLSWSHRPDLIKTLFFKSGKGKKLEKKLIHDALALMHINGARAELQLENAYTLRISEEGQHPVNILSRSAKEKLGTDILYSPRTLLKSNSHGAYDATENSVELLDLEELLHPSKSSVLIHELRHAYLRSRPYNEYQIFRPIYIRDSQPENDFGYAQYLNFEEISTFAITLRLRVSQLHRVYIKVNSKKRTPADLDEFKFLLKLVYQTASQGRKISELISNSIDVITQADPLRYEKSVSHPSHQRNSRPKNAHLLKGPVVVLEGHVFNLLMPALGDTDENSIRLAMKTLEMIKDIVTKNRIHYKAIEDLFSFEENKPAAIGLEEIQSIDFHAKMISKNPVSTRYWQPTLD